MICEHESFKTLRDSQPSRASLKLLKEKSKPRQKKTKKRRKIKVKKRAVSLLNKETGSYLPFPLSPNKKTLVLDMDETLIHTDEIKSFEYDQIVVQKEDGYKTKHYMSIRPGVSEFLSKFYAIMSTDRMAKLYEIVIFTASLRSYALPMIANFDADKRISHVLARDH